MTVGGMGFIPERLLMMMMMIYRTSELQLLINNVYYTLRRLKKLITPLRNEYKNKKNAKMPQKKLFGA